MRKLILALLLLSTSLFAQSPNSGKSTFIPFGGVVSQTANYTARAQDVGKLIEMNCSSCTFTLPASAPSDQWSIFVENLNASNLTVSTNGKQMNGSTVNVTLVQNAGLYITSDGSKYYSLPTSANSGGAPVDLSAYALLDSPVFRTKVTLPVLGTIQCLHVDQNGEVSGTGQDCGAGGQGGGGNVSTIGTPTQYQWPSGKIQPTLKDKPSSTLTHVTIFFP